MTRMTIGRLAVAAGAHVTTIRFYERAGLLPPPGRSAGGHRIYGHDHLQRLIFIRRARELEFSIDTIRQLLVIADTSRASCGDVHVLAAAHLDALRGRIADLSKLEARLTDTLAQCAREAPAACSLLQLLRRAS
jgi:MerR family transcriptional regulator, mercuric resistance operon regulatory protein